MKDKNTKYPQKKSKGDLVHSIVKGATGMIPIAGAPTSELLNYLLTPPLEKRRSKWFEEIGERLREL